jgi:hypothetical protein
MRRRLISRSVLSCRTLLTDRHKRSPGAVSFASTHRKRVDGSAAEVPIWSGAGLILINDWSGDGQYLLLTLLIPATPALECGCSRTSRALDDARSRAVRHGRQRHRSRPVRPVTRAAARDHHRRGSGAGNAWDEARSVADRKRECPSATVAQGRAGALLPRRWLPAGCRTSGIDHGLQVWTAAPPLPATVRLPDRRRTVGAGMPAPGSAIFCVAVRCRCTPRRKRAVQVCSAREQPAVPNRGNHPSPQRPLHQQDCHSARAVSCPW